MFVIIEAHKLVDLLCFLRRKLLLKLFKCLLAQLFMRFSFHHDRIQPLARQLQIFLRRMHL